MVEDQADHVLARFGTQQDASIGRTTTGIPRWWRASGTSVTSRSPITGAAAEATALRSLSGFFSLAGVVGCGRRWPRPVGPRGVTVMAIPRGGRASPALIVLSQMVSGSFPSAGHLAAGDGEVHDRGEDGRPKGHIGPYNPSSASTNYLGGVTLCSSRSTLVRGRRAWATRCVGSVQRGTNGEGNDVVPTSSLLALGGREPGHRGRSRGLHFDDAHGKPSEGCGVGPVPAKDVAEEAVAFWGVPVAVSLVLRHRATSRMLTSPVCGRPGLRGACGCATIASIWHRIHCGRVALAAGSSGSPGMRARSDRKAES